MRAAAGEFFFTLFFELPTVPGGLICGKYLT
jgi:hypothetical protein